LGQGSLIQVKIGKVSSGQFSWLDNPTSAVDKPDNQTTRQFAVVEPDVCRQQARQPYNQTICSRWARHLPSTGPTTIQPDNLPSTGPTSAVDRPDIQTTRQFAVDGPDICRQQARQSENPTILRRRAPDKRRCRFCRSPFVWREAFE
jgi:hypothetical protein